jgi:hypothetical protein
MKLNLGSRDKILPGSSAPAQGKPFWKSVA